MAGLTPLTQVQRSRLKARVEAYVDQLGPRGRAYLSARGLLDMASILRFGEVRDPLGGDERFTGRLAIPTFSARGTPVGMTFRCMEAHDCAAEEHGKYLNMAHLDSRLYQVGSVQTNGSVIHIAEGQLDTATLLACGLPAVGVPGSQAWRPSSHRLFQGFDRVVFWADQDDKGASMKLFERVRQGVSAAEVMMVADGQDVNSFYVEHGRAGILSLLQDQPEGEDDADDDEPPF